MADQPAYRPMDPSPLFADGKSARPLVYGTVPRGEARLDLAMYHGLREDSRSTVPPDGVALAVARTDLAEKPYVDRFPFPVTEEVLRRGQSRFMAFCAPCHDAAGTGNGSVVQRGFTQPPSYHTDRLRAAPAGYFFDVITRGYGSMPEYAESIAPRDRWAVVAYVRALQLSQHTRLADLREDERNEVLSKLSASPKAAASNVAASLRDASSRSRSDRPGLISSAAPEEDHRAQPRVP